MKKKHDKLRLLSSSYIYLFFLFCRVGHNEVIGVCRVGNEAETLGRNHWNEMLSYPRKPIAHWHPLVEVWAACVLLHTVVYMF